MKETADEYDKRESQEAIVAKDADMLDQIFLLREYVWQGNKEAQIWLEGKPGGEKQNVRDRFKTENAKKLCDVAMTEDPSSWWNNLWTSKNR